MGKFCWRLKLSIFFAICMFVITISAVNPRQTRNDDQNTKDALKYLQALDSIYSNSARPRHIRSDETSLEPEAPDLQTAIHLLRLDTIDRIYSSHNRPRFGKRSNYYKVLRDRTFDDDDLEEWLSGPPYFNREGI